LPRPALLDWARRGDLAPALKFMALGGLMIAAAALAKFLYDANSEVGRETAAIVLSAALALVGLALVPWRALALGVLGAAMLVQGGLQTIKDSRDGLRTRSYFGVYTVRDYPLEQQRTLAHGTTLHGRQSTDPAARCLPLTYYGPGSGAGIAFANASRLVPGRAMIGVVGLGTGSLLGYARPGQSWSVFEIDETVLDLSRQGKFTYLSGCAPGAQIVLGDARLKLAQVRPGTYDLLAIDAFSSDSIPLHLFTHEAFGVYMQALAPRGVLMVHISNRFIDLEPALAAAVKARCAPSTGCSAS